MVLDAAEHEYVIGDDPPCTWCPGLPLLASSTGVLAENCVIPIRNLYSGVLDAAEHEYAIGDEPPVHLVRRVTFTHVIHGSFSQKLYYTD